MRFSVLAGVKKALMATVIAGSGQAAADNTPWDLTANAVLIYQAAHNSSVNPETSASADVMFQREVNSGLWLVHIEASTSGKTSHISSVFPEANADAASALDKDLNGRIQVSELYYMHSLSNQQKLSAGLLDVSGFFEQSRIASDETTQFLGASFTGNPSIAFPDYTVGVVYEHALPNNLAFRAAVASSNGLADNPERSYAKLFTFTDDNKGVFGISSLSWQAKGWLLRSGAWINTADHHSLGLATSVQNNYGLYMLAGYKYGLHAVNFRFGAANPAVSQGAMFASTNYLYQLGQYSAGAGVGRTYISSDEPTSSLKNTTQYEIFLRYTLTPAWLLTADLQRIINSNFAASTEQHHHRVTLLGLRLTWLYNQG